MTTGPRVILGMAAYNRPDTLARTLESLLAQTYRDFAVHIVDDGPSPAVQAIIDAYTALDPRITYEANDGRLGMIDNWRKAFTRARQLYPGSEYFAWVSDHDIWHPRWLEVLVPALDERPEVVMAYPQMQRIYTQEDRRFITRRFETVGMVKPTERLRRAITYLTAGNAVYGLFRISAMLQAGVFRRVLAPDRQLLMELTLLGEFRHVPEMLWYREVAGNFSLKRQRQMLFSARPPLYSYLPPIIQHFGLLLWDFGARGNGRSAFGRLKGSWYAVLFLGYSLRREMVHDEAWWRKVLARTALGRVLQRRNDEAAA
ncbi:MAG: glycosyltransferase family 2 protein [Acidobacteria bacterium]|nr:glycosyltransferase family 2 protein [Acidobacteriota bacterium]